MKRLLSSTTKLLTPFKKVISTTDLAKTPDRMFGVNPRSKIAVFCTTYVYFVPQFKDEIKQLTSQMNVARKHMNQKCPLSRPRLFAYCVLLFHLFDSTVCTISILMKNPIDANFNMISKQLCKKSKRRSLLANPTTGFESGRLFQVFEQCTSMKFLLNFSVRICLTSVLSVDTTFILPISFHKQPIFTI